MGLGQRSTIMADDPYADAPDYVRLAARANLAAVDGGIANFNTTAAALPSPTPAANLAIAGAMDRADTASALVGGFRAPVQPTVDPQDLIDTAIAKRQQLLAQGIDPDKPAIYPNDRRRQEMLHEQLGLSEIQHRSVLEKAAMSGQLHKNANDIDSANQYIGFSSALRGIQAPLGTPEHADAVLDKVKQYPLAVHTAAGRALLNIHTTIHDAAAGLIPPSQYATTDQAWNENPGATLRRDPKTGGWVVTGLKAPLDQVASEDKELDKDAKTFGVGLAQIRNPVRVEVGNVDENGKFVGDVKGTNVRLDTGKVKDGKTEHVMMSKAQYLKFGGGLSPESMSDSRASTAAPTTTALQFDDEAQARAAGHKAGDVVTLLNPATKKYQRARLD